MLNYDILKFYSRKDIQKEIIKLSRNREVAVNFGEKGYGKRPDTLEYENDILELAKQGATSFHVSLEHFKDPLKLKTGMSQKELEELRTGFDIIIDLDTKIFEISQICAYLIVEALKFHNVKNISLKFSGNQGIHIAIPFQSFPSTVNNKEIKTLFPDGVKVLNIYLKNFIKEHLKEKILDNFSLEDLSLKLKKSPDGLKENNQFNPFKVIDIDSILISPRHLFRSVYSINEKSGLVSIPIHLNNILKFQREEAKIEKVKVEEPFLEFKGDKQDASDLIIQAFDFYSKISRKKDAKLKTEEKIFQQKKEYEVPKIAIKEDLFPPCVKLILQGVQQDGRKRAVFILINFLKKMGWSLDQIQARLLEWNKVNYEPLREGYIISQINWHKKQKQEILPPNCDNPSYYTGMLVCKPDFYCRNIKNPVQQTMKKINKETK
ncbi:MAG: hypothetical protein AABW58_00105 [Nanoarchaeota archaeon]